MTIYKRRFNCTACGGEVFYDSDTKILSCSGCIKLKVEITDKNLQEFFNDNQVMPHQDESDILKFILRNAHLLTCYNCGEKLKDKYNKVKYHDSVAVLHIDSGRINYPREPDEPAVAYFECIECATKAMGGSNDECK